MLGHIGDKSLRFFVGALIMDSYHSMDTYQFTVFQRIIASKQRNPLCPFMDIDLNSIREERNQRLFMDKQRLQLYALHQSLNRNSLGQIKIKIICFDGYLIIES